MNEVGGSDITRPVKGFVAEDRNYISQEIWISGYMFWQLFGSLGRFLVAIWQPFGSLGRFSIAICQPFGRLGRIL
jgi:hypothetical protein